VGKTMTAQPLARRRERGACIDVDDIRHLVVSGHVPPWEGREGLLQQQLGVENACSLAGRFLAAGIEVTIADVLDVQTTAIYRRKLPGCLIVRLVITFDEAVRRANSRTIFLTDEEFARLHRQDRQQQLSVDHDVDVEHLSKDQQITVVEDIWNASEKSV
jgi:hypothetical protein